MKLAPVLIFLGLETLVPLPAFYLLAKGFMPPLFFAWMAYSRADLVSLSLAHFLIYTVICLFVSRIVWSFVRARLGESKGKSLVLSAFAAMVVLAFFPIYSPVCHGSCGSYSWLGIVNER